MNKVDRERNYPPDPEAVRAVISGLSTDGRGVTRVDERAVFVERALPGDEVELSVDWSSKPPAGTILSTVRPSPQRVEHPCPHAQVCPASPWGALRYEEQLKQKTELVARTLSKTLGEVSVSPMLPSPRQWHYRNRVSLRLWQEDDRLRLGYRLGPRDTSAHAIDCCRLAVEAVDRCIGDLQSALANYRGGSIDSMPVRVQVHATALGAGLMIVFANRIHASQRSLWNKWLSNLNIPGGVWFATGNRAGSITGQSWAQAEHGAEPMLTEWLGRPLKVHPAAFCQANACAAEIVCKILRTRCSTSPPATVWDLYGGYGALGLAAANKYSRIKIIEASKWSESISKSLASAAGTPEPDFFCGDVLAEFRKVSKSVMKNDLLILDPPKSGAHRDVLEQIARTKVAGICYLSCNPARLGRDLESLLGHGFRIVELQPVDFFPQTASIETLAFLER